MCVARPGTLNVKMMFVDFQIKSQVMTHTFFRLSDALKRKQVNPEESVFAKEVGRLGRRLFITCTKVRKVSVR